MKKIKFGLIGSGYRGQYFIRIAKALPEIFELSAVCIRDKEKGEKFAKEFEVNVVNTFDELKVLGIEFVVLAIKREFVSDTLVSLYEKNIPVLCETPPSDSVEDLRIIWENTQKYNGKIQISEQYFLQPLYSSWQNVINSGVLGEIQNVTISALHGYHGVSMIRKYLGVGFENCKITGKTYDFKVAKTSSREGLCFTGVVIPNQRQKITLEFESGKVGFFDFSFIQYHSFIRTRQLNVQGIRGEIDDLEVRYLNDENIPVLNKLNRVDLGIYNGRGWNHLGIMMNDKYLYENPFQSARLNDDEIAVATCMYKMSEYVQTGVEFYSLKDGLQDAYIAEKMTVALANPGACIETSTQNW